MRRGLPQYTIAKRAPEGTKAHAGDPDIERWENEGGSVGHKRGLVAKSGPIRPVGMRL